MVLNILGFVLLILIKIASTNQDCFTVPTPRGTQWPERCIFPFFFMGRRFYICTQDFAPDNKFWCSVEVDANGNHKSGGGRFGHCSQECFMTRLPIVPSSNLREDNVKFPIITTGGPTPNVNCIFPFKFRGVWHSKCLPDEDNPVRTWCSTKVDTSRKHQQGHWGFCKAENVALGLCFS